MKIKEIQDNLTKEFGQYELKKQIGEGGNAPVFRIRNKKNGKEFALKYPSFGKNDNKKKKRFKNEIQIVKKNRRQHSWSNSYFRRLKKFFILHNADCN